MKLLPMDRAVLTYLIESGGSAPTIAIPAKLFRGEIPKGAPNMVDLGLIEHIGEDTIVTAIGRSAIHQIGRFSPFWRCSHCEASQIGCEDFKHEVGCPGASEGSTHG